MKKQPDSELQTPATSTPDEMAHAAGMGGSYSIGPDGQAVLLHRTQGAGISRKAPLTGADGSPAVAAEAPADVAANSTTGTD